MWYEMQLTCSQLCLSNTWNKTGNWRHFHNKKAGKKCNPKTILELTKAPYGWKYWRQRHLIGQVRENDAAADDEQNDELTDV